MRRIVEDETPLFTVCLGAQTLARAFGAEVSSIGVPLAGFYETTLTDKGVDRSGARRDAATTSRR